MEEVLGYLLNSVLHAQTIADFEALRVAQEYRKHPLLIHFRVPCVNATEVELDLKFAIKKNVSEPFKIAIEDIPCLSKSFSDLLLNLPHTEGFSSFLEKETAFQEEWKKSQEPLVHAFISLLKTDLPLSTKDLVASILQLVKNGVLHALTKMKKEQTFSFIDYFFKPFVLPFEAHKPWATIQNAIFKILQESAEKKKEEKPVDPINVIFDAETLSHLPPEVINSASLSLQLGRKEWVSLPSPDGSVSEKLVSS